jgi:hypothetical protein
MTRGHNGWTKARFAFVVAAVIGLTASPVPGRAATPDGQPCPDRSATVGFGKGNSAGNPASEQGVEHSAILPEVGGEESAAPTIKKDGQEVDATECPKPPNQLNSDGNVK